MREHLRVYLDSPIAAEIEWAWALFARDAGLRWERVETFPVEGGSDVIVVSENPSARIRLDQRFRERFQRGVYASAENMPDGPCLYTEDGKPDYLSSIFYLVNALQEYGHHSRDRYGRFPWQDSLQARWDVADKDLVSEYMQTLYRDLQRDFDLPPWPQKSSRIFLSHDIDRIWEGWKDDGKHALRRGRPDQLAALLWRTAKGRPDWLNMEEMMEHDRQHDMPAVFFWIPRQSRSGDFPPDADYALDQKPIRQVMEQIDASEQFELGFHTSVHGDALAERQRFPFAVSINRNHFLSFRLPELFERIERLGFSADASLGFAARHGFRNSYGRPFQPWNVARRRPYRFTEVPLHLMDTTFDFYRLREAEERGETLSMEARAEIALREGKEWISRHASGAVISILWHNNYFSNGAYAPFKPVLGEWLQHARSLGIRGIGLDELLDLYGQNK